MTFNRLWQHSCPFFKKKGMVDQTDENTSKSVEQENEDLTQAENKQEQENSDQSSSEQQLEEHENAEQNPADDSSLAREYEEMRNKYLRLVAEFDNYRKRTNREKLELVNTAGEKVISELLPVLDDFDRAKATAEDENTKEVFSEGVSLVYEKLYKTLHQLGLKAMQSKGKAFDPELHEAITEIASPNEDMKGKVIDVIEEGYELNERIIRHAKVVVGK